MEKFKNREIICFYGDSITHDGTWINKIYDYYISKTKTKVEIYNWGVSGNNSIKAINRINKILDLKPNIVVIMFGMNDVYYPFYGSNKSGKKIEEQRAKVINDNIANYKKICQILSNNKIRLILCTPTAYDEISDSKETNYIGTNGALKIFGDKIKKIAKKYNADIVDFYSLMNKAQKEATKENKSYCRIDRIHPNQAGHELMARYFLKQQGFEIEFTLDYMANEKYSSIPYGKIAAERKRLEEIAKSTQYAPYDYFWYIKDENEVLEMVKKELKGTNLEKLFKGDTLTYIKEQFKLYIKNFDVKEKHYIDYIKYIKKVVTK